MTTIAQKWPIHIVNCSLLDVKKHHPNVTAIVNAANVYMRGGKMINLEFYLKKKEYIDCLF